MSPTKRYYQQLVLMNRADVNNKRVERSYVNASDNYLCRYAVYFDLLPETTGFRFTTNENASVIFGTSEKIEERGTVHYIHNVQLVVAGVDEQTKCLLSQLDQADMFAALQLYDGTVEIYGFEFGLGTSGYTYDPSNSEGVTVIKLTSFEDCPEDDLPLVYKSQGDANQDFNNNFSEHTFEILGDFNYDFNFDFFNQGL